jgi:hypothetical protein
MPITMSKVRSLPDRRPGLADVRDVQEPALIEEREMSASACYHPSGFEDTRYEFRYELILTQ